MNKEKYILITGASGGIGSEIAKKLADEGYSLYLHYFQNKQFVEDLITLLGQKYPSQTFISIGANLLRDSECRNLCQEIYKLDGIIHNSGISYTKLLTQMTDEEINDLVRIHLTAPILITKILLNKFIQQQEGNIIFISSIWGQVGGSCETIYSAVKGGQIAFAKALSKEVALSNIRVNIVAPGAIQTKMVSNLDRTDLESLEDEIPLGRLGDAIDVANAVNFLLSDQSGYITGHELNVNGGWYM